MHFSLVCPQHNSKVNDSKVFKLGIGNNLGISYRTGVSRSQVRVRVRLGT